MSQNPGVTAGPDPSSPLRHRPVFLVCIALLGAWLCFPALTSVHVEGFSANLQSIAILLHRHGSTGLQLADQQYPVVTEYLYMTRSGLVDALQALMALTGSHSDGVFRALILLSFVGYFLACRHIARVWSGESNALLILAYLLTPGLVEIAFYFADNLTSAMFAMFGLAFIRRHRPTPAWIWCCAGGCLSIATLIRVDAILTVPAFGLGLLLFRKQVWQLVRNVVAFAIGGLAVLLLAQLATPFQLTDSLQISHMFQSLHHEVENHRLLIIIAHSFFGPVTFLLLLFGIAQNLRTRRWQWNLGLTVLPIAFYLYVLPHALEARMFLLLGAPAVLIQAATGLRVLGDWWSPRSGSRRVLAATVSLLFAGIFFGPVLTIVFHDGPRTVLGRFWSPLIWREWQQSTQNGMKQIDHLAESVQPHETMLVVSGHFNADHYLRLRLLQSGFDIAPASMGGECGRQIEIFHKLDRTVIHIRSEAPYGIANSPEIYLKAWQVASELGCVQATDVTSAELISWHNLPAFFLPAMKDKPLESKELDVSFPSATWIPTRGHYSYGKMYLQPLTADQVSQLRVAAQGFASNPSGETPVHQIENYAQLHSMYRWRFGRFAAK